MTGREPGDSPGGWPPDALAHHARVRPDAVAVLDDRGPPVTFAALDRRATAVAAAVAARGLGAEDVVAVLAPRAWESVAAACGVLRAGAAFLLLEGEHPVRRLQEQLDDARAALLLTDPALLRRRPLSAPRVGGLDPAGAGAAPPPAVGGPRQAAYAVSTSGSTGRPKVVLLERRGLENLLCGEVAALGLRPGDRVLHFASVAFDAVVWEVLGAVCAGATLVVHPRTGADVATLAELVRLHRVAVATLPPTLLRLLEPADVPSLRTVVSAGEACTGDVVERWAGAGRRLLNAYGPAEATVCATIGGCRAGEDTPPIGDPLPGVRVHLLDSDGCPVPAGSPGELCLGGAGVARGYAGQPGLTAERFVPDPCGPAGDRLYRTGDVCRRRADGALVFLGRRDAQVKLSGQRIELEEIEHALRGLPAVRDVAAALVPAGGPRLVAYVVLERGASLTLAAVQAHLRARLPDFMVPGLVAVVPILPLSSGGKVDRRALPPPAEAELLRPGAPGAAATPTETAVASVLAELLGVGGLQPDDDVVALGGDSLAAVRAAARLEAALDRPVPAGLLLRQRTVAAVAAELDRSGAGAAWPPVLPWDRAQPVAPASPSQERVLFLHELAPASRAYQAQGLVRLRGPLRPPALRLALRDVVERHEAYRTTFEWRDGAAVQVVHEPGPVALPEIDLTHLDPAAREGALAARVASLVEVAIDPGRLPLARWTLVRLAAADHVLVVVEHHLVHDGWSFNVFLRDLLVAYRHRTGQGPAPPRPALQFRDLATWQREHLRGPLAEAQLGFWRAALAGGAATALPVPAPAVRAAGHAHRGAAIRAAVPGPLLQDAAALARRRGVTLFTLLFAAFSALVHRLSGEADVSVGSSVANRRRPESEDLVGMLVNTVVLRTRLDARATFHDHLERARRVVAAASDNQDVPFHQVVEALSPARSPGANPLFRIMFSLHDSPVTAVPPPGLAVETTVALANGSAKFDLNLTLLPRLAGRRLVGMEAVLEHDTAVLPAEVAAETWRSYLALLGHVVAAPAGPLSTAPLLDGDQLRRLDRWRGEPAPVAGGRPWEAVWRWADRQPEAVALQDAAGTLTYGALVAAAERLAQVLIDGGVGEDEGVGVRMEPGRDLVTAALALWRAGGAYVPVEPALPAARARAMLGGAGVGLLLTTEALREETAGWGVPTLCPDAGAVARALDWAGRRLAGGVAYVLFTSGSTGAPKGITVPHDSLQARFAALSERLGSDGTGETWLAASSPGFDISLTEWLWPLTRGARVVTRAPAPGGSGREAAGPGVSLFLLGSDELLPDLAVLADEGGLEAVWTAGRHAALAAAAVAGLTRRVGVRAAGVTLPPDAVGRVAAEWAMLHRLSAGRAGVALSAPGPALRRGLEQVRARWRGGGREAPAIWLTPADGAAAYAEAGALGGNVLARLPWGPALRLREWVAAYRAARRRAGWSGAGHVTLIAPTLLAGDGELDAIGEPALEAVLGRRPGGQSRRAFLRWRELGLFGPPQRCRRELRALAGLGVDEVACLLDWGTSPDAVLDGARRLAELAVAARPAARRSSPVGSLPDLALARGVTHLQCTPSMARLLLAEPRARAALGSLHALLLAGEPLAADLAGELVEIVRGGRVLNLYGPTETTVYATMADVTAELHLDPGGPVSIGRPLAGATVQVVDARLQPVPPGFPGELCVGGVGLATGYVGGPRETAERFVPDPWSERPGARLYRTGDVVHLLPDGRLGFLGRVDRQVKLHGHRIELAEVEQALRRHPEVRDAAVVLDGSGPEPVLVAVVEAARADPAELRRHLLGLLPAAMLPGRVVAVGSLPLTPNGKVDVRAVAQLAAGAPAAPVAASRPADREQPPPAEHLAARVADAWRQVLRRDVVPDLDFFEAGGHSMLALRLTSTLSAGLGVHVPLSMLFEAPRLADFTARVADLRP